MARNKHIPDIAQFIAPLNMNGLQGRMLVAPPNSHRKREIMVVYGHHTQLESWWGFINNLQDYGKVTVPDLPGFRGMDSFYRIGKQPTIDNFADYLAAFVRLRYKRRRLVIIGISFGFVVASRMLQRYPDLAKKVDLVVNMAGFMHRDDFRLKPVRRRILSGLIRFCGTRPAAILIRYTVLNEPMMRIMQPRIAQHTRMMATMDLLAKTDPTKPVDSRAWRINDVATHWQTLSQCLKLDNCKQKVDVPVWSVATKDERLIDNAIVEQHVLVVFSSNKNSFIDIVATDYTTKAGAATLLPASLRKALSS